jgi:hypothetical protein
VLVNNAATTAATALTFSTGIVIPVDGRRLG